ncbi:hypothetical protein M5K25_020885 [Dendrobium thyrsiflorum]|uniref:Uncharacterized protein n=1 Tax=Dendrobium thyrsiflorum TaxID=117978 RepID=A0ABD0UI26_DENTH
MKFFSFVGIDGGQESGCVGGTPGRGDQTIENWNFKSPRSSFRCQKSNFSHPREDGWEFFQPGGDVEEVVRGLIQNGIVRGERSLQQTMKRENSNPISQSEETGRRYGEKREEVEHEQKRVEFERRGAEFEGERGNYDRMGVGIERREIYYDPRGAKFERRIWEFDESCTFAALLLKCSKRAAKGQLKSSKSAAAALLLRFCCAFAALLLHFCCPMQILSKMCDALL